MLFGFYVAVFLAVVIKKLGQTKALTQTFCSLIVSSF